MKLFLFWVCAAGVLAGLRFAVLPLLERRLSRGNAKNLPFRGGLLAAFSTLAFVALMAVVSVGLALCCIWLVDLQGGNSVGAVSASLERVRRWREIWMEWTPAWAIGVGLLLLLALVVFAARKGSIRCRKTIESARESEFNLLFERWKREELEDLPPSDEMKQLWQRREEAIAALGQLPPDGPDVAPHRQQIENYLTEVARAFVVLDLRRRMKQEIDPDLVRIPQPRTRWEKVQTFFISQGLLVNLGRANRVVFALGLLLLFPCLIGVSRPLGLASIEAKISQLGMLRLRLSAQEVKADWEAEKQKIDGQTALTAEDGAAIAAIAREWEEEEADAPFLRATTARLAPNFAVRSVSARDRILRRAAEQRPEQLEHRKAAALDAADRPAIAEAVPDAAGERRGPQTASAKRVQAELSEKAARAPPKFMERLRGEVAAFQKPTTARALRRAVAVQWASALVDGNTADSVFSQAAQAVDSRQRELFRARTDASADHFLTSIARGEPVEEAIRRSHAPEVLDHLFTPSQLDDLHQTVRRAGADLPDNERLVRRFQDHPPSLEIKPDVDANRRVTTVLDDFRRVSKREATQLASLTESLNSYPDYFPGQLGAEERTPRGDLTRKWEGGTDLPGTVAGPNAKPKPPPVRPKTPSVTAPRSVTLANFKRARSFTGLRGFSRVGGVLIGREPESGPELKIENLRWEMPSAGRVQLILRDASGREYRSMPHRTEIVAQALTYAADGRPLAVTMATAQPLIELKILLHPALLDTQLGASVTELDRFVDTYAGKVPFRIEAMARVEQQAALYRLAWAQRMMLLDSSVTREAKGLSQLFEFADRQLASKDLHALAAAGIQAGALVLDGSSLLEVKSEFYDNSLVRAMRGAPKESVEVFLAGIQSTFAKDGVGLRSIIEADLQDRSAYGVKVSNPKELLDRWLPPPPRFEIWSGVREKPYRLDPSDLLIRDGQAIPVLFDFMLQVAFTSDPAFGVNREAEEGTYTDSKPWEFPSIKEAIQKNVLSSVERDAGPAAVLRDTTEFACLQRLFRCAFEGRFGEDFPIESLDRLAAELGKTPPATARTPRWNPRPGVIEVTLLKVINSLGGTDAQSASERVVSSLQACANLLKKSIERRQRYQEELLAAHGKGRTPNPAALDLIWTTLDADLQKWEAAWATAAAELQSAASVSPALVAALDGFNELSAALKLRRALGVQNEERPSLRE